MVNVVTVETDDFLKVGNFAAAGNLPESSNTRLNTNTALVVGGILIIFVDRRWTSTNERHAASEYVKELR